jgi:hypothetical protein
VGQNDTNFSLLIGSSGTNNVTASINSLGANDTNFSLLIGANDTNFSRGIIGSNGTNFSLLIGSNGTNYSLLIGANDTNFSLLLGANDTNFSRGVIGANGTNYTADAWLSVSNFAKAGTNGMASLIAFQPKGVPAFMNVVVTNTVKQTNGVVLAGKGMSLFITNGIIGGFTAP